jgi:cell division transport system permease protein
VHVYYLKEAWRSFRQHKGLASAAMFSLTAILLLCGVFLLLTHNASRAVAFLGDRREMVVYLRDEITTEQREALVARLTELYGTVTYVSRQQAWEEFSQEVGDPQLLESVDQNPLPASLHVHLRPELLNFTSMDQAARQVSQFPEVEDVRFGGEWVRRLDELQAGLLRGSLVVGIVVALLIVIVLHNTIRLTVLARHREVEIMNRLGATARFIAAPFALEAVGETLVSALVALALLFGLEQLAIQQGLHAAFLPPTWIAGFLMATVLLAWGAASLALARALRAVGP